MTERHRLCGSVVPFARRWHVVQEIDLARLLAEHARLARLCDELEACADSLPTLPEADARDALCHRLHGLVKRDQQDEDSFLAQLFGHDLADPLTVELLRRIRCNHIADAGRAHELIAALRPDAGVAPELLGYLLRGFFDGCRSAIAFEQLAVLALARARLTTEAEALLVSSLVARL